MMGRTKLLRYCFLLSWICLIQGCDPDRVFEEYTGMESLQWDLNDTVTFQLNPVQTEPVVATVGIRYNDSFDFHNLYVRYLIRDSTGKSLEDSLINMALFDSKTGRPLGKGFGNVYTKYDTLSLTRLQENQALQVQFIQYMRREQLGGIEAVGLKVYAQP